MADPAGFAYMPPDMANAYGPPLRSQPNSTTVQGMADRMAIERGRNQASSEMLDQALDRAFQRANGSK